MTTPNQHPVAIVGVGREVVHASSGVKPTALQLGARAAASALRDAGVSRTDVHALFTGRSPQAYTAMQYNQLLLSELKLEPSFNTMVTAHGAGAIGSIALAEAVLQNADVHYVLCVTNEAAGLWLDQARMNPAWEADPQFEIPYGVSTPALYAQFASRFMHETGVTPEDAAMVAVQNRRWAVQHPQAATRHKGEITVDDVLASPVITTPFRLLDCAIWYPGGIATALVLTRADTAAARHDQVTYVAGVGQSTTHERVSEMANRPSRQGRPPGVHTGAAEAARQAYAHAGLTPADVDLAQSSVPFSYVLLMMLEELGFCGRGEAADFVRSGGIDYDSGFPFNTNGGYLSFGQVAQGLYALTETIDQLHGQAPGRQVPDATIGLVHSHGGPLACHAVCLVTTEQTRSSQP